ALQETIIDSAESAMSGLVAAGEMRAPTSPTTTRMLARNWWLMWLGWLSIEQLEHPELEMVPDSALFDGALQSHSIVQPYFEPACSAGYLVALSKSLMAGKGAGSNAGEIPQDLKPPASVQAAVAPKKRKAGSRR